MGRVGFGSLGERGKGALQGKNLLFPCCASRGRSTVLFKTTLFFIFFVEKNEFRE